MKRVVILRGLPGSGKSLRAEELMREAAGRFESVVVVSADDFFLKLSEDTIGGVPIAAKEYCFDATKLPEAHADCERRFLRAVEEQRELIVIDNVHAQRWQFENYQKIAQLLGYEVTVEVMHAPLNASGAKACLEVADILFFAKRSRHKVPVAVVAGMACRWED